MDMNHDNKIKVLDDIVKRILLSRVYMISNDENNDDEYIFNKKIELLNLLIDDMNYKDIENINRVKYNFELLLIFNENFSNEQLINIKDSLMNDLPRYKDYTINDLLSNLRNDLMGEKEVEINLPSEENPLKDDKVKEIYNVDIIKTNTDSIISEKFYIKIIKNNLEYNIELF
jgi:hypothetical protein